jgi:iron complex outermembrane receptor protein
MVYQTEAQTRHQVFTPEHAATLGADYQTLFDNYTLRFHVDGNWNNGYYTSSSDIALGGGVYKEQLQSQAAIVVNGRVSVGDIPLASSGGTLTVSVWVRNLFDEEHMTTRSLSVTTGISGAFNDPRTFGIQASARF